MLRMHASQRSMLEKQLSRALRSGAPSDGNMSPEDAASQSNAASQALLTLHTKLITSQQALAGAEAALAQVTDERDRAVEEAVAIRGQLETVQRQNDVLGREFTASRDEAASAQRELEEMGQKYSQAVEKLLETKQMTADLMNELNAARDGDAAEEGDVTQEPGSGSAAKVKSHTGIIGAGSGPDPFTPAHPEAVIPDEPAWHAEAGHSHTVLSCALSSDGLKLATGGDDRVVRVWDTMSGSPVAAVQKALGGASCVAWLGDQVLVCGHSNGSVRVIDAPSGRARHTLSGHTGNIFTTAGLDGDHFATGSQDRSVRLWSATRGTAIATLAAGSPATAMAASPDGQLLWTGHMNRAVMLWDVRQRSVAIEMPNVHSQMVSSIDTFTDGRRLLTNGLDSRLHILDSRSLAVSGTMADSRFVSTARYSHAAIGIGNYIYVPTKGAGICVFDSATETCTKVLKGHKADVVAVAGRAGVIASVDKAGGVVVWGHGT